MSEYCQAHFIFTATTGTINHSVRVPSWLTANPRVGSADRSGAIVTFVINAEASKMQPGNYGPAIGFTNVTNGRGTTTRGARLTVFQVGKGRLLDGRDRPLLDDSGLPLMAR